MRRCLPFILLILALAAACNTTPSIEDGYVENGDHPLYYKTLGSGDPIVVLHGGPGFDHRQFLPFIWELAVNHQVILYDQRCTGLSSGPADSTTITLDTFIEDIEVIRRHFGIEKMNLLGHSWGGNLAMQYALRHEDKLKSLILCSTTATDSSYAEMRATYEENRAPGESDKLMEIYQSNAFQAGDPTAYEAFWRLYFRPYFADPNQVDKMDLLFTENTINNSNTVAGLIFADIGSFDLHEDLKNLKVPTAVFHGDADPLHYKYGEQIHQSIAGSHFLLMEDVGHWLFVDGTDYFAGNTRAFLDSISTE